MALDSADFISDLSTADPTAGDKSHQLDDQVRAIKRALRKTFAGGDFNVAATGLTQALLNGLEARIAALEALPTPTTVSPEIGTEANITSTGDYAVTGLGFEPALVLVFASVQSATYAAHSVGAGNASWSTGRCVHTAKTSAGNDSGEYESAQIIKLEQGSGGTRAAATLSSLDSDGFTINFSSISSRCDFTWIAFP